MYWACWLLHECAYIVDMFSIVFSTILPLTVNAKGYLEEMFVFTLLMTVV